jgi:hypothetical protein
VSELLVTSGSVEVEELTPEQGYELLERSAQEAFGVSWGEFRAMYQAGKFTGTPDARVAEELAFLAPLAG